MFEIVYGPQLKQAREEYELLKAILIIFVQFDVDLHKNVSHTFIQLMCRSYVDCVVCWHFQLLLVSFDNFFKACL